MIRTEDFEQVEVTSAAALRAWLEQHHARERGVWLVTWKKAVPTRYVSKDEVLDELMCFGWVDGVARVVDGQRTMQLISPRRAQHWARSYKTRVARLADEGRMHPAGTASVQAARASGAWTFMDDVDDLVVPADLAAALADRPGAAAYFDAIPPAARRNTLRLIKLARTTVTRARRVAQTADLAQRGQRVPGT